MLIFLYLGRTQITAAGCGFLIQSDWKLLTELNMGIICENIGGDKIGNEGCAILARSNWKHLSKLTLCNNMSIKVEIRSETRDVSTWLRLIGRSLLSYFYVYLLLM